MDTVPWIASGSKAAVEEFENGLPEVTVLVLKGVDHSKKSLSKFHLNMFY